jgi:hypothetical protein
VEGSSPASLLVTGPVFAIDISISLSQRRWAWAKGSVGSPEGVSDRCHRAAAIPLSLSGSRSLGLRSQTGRTVILTLLSLQLLRYSTLAGEFLALPENETETGYTMFGGLLTTCQALGE